MRYIYIYILIIGFWRREGFRLKFELCFLVATCRSRKNEVERDSCGPLIGGESQNFNTCELLILNKFKI